VAADHQIRMGVLTIRRLALGSGYKYLTESIAIGDGPAPKGTPLTRYYEATGTPPGVWLGAGLAGLDGGRGVQSGSQVTEEQLYNMLGVCVDPVSGEACGRKPNAEPESFQGRVARRIAGLPDDLEETARTVQIAEIEIQERVRTAKFRPPVAAFDLTFSPQKSVSVAWALADRDTQTAIYELHRRAIAVTLDYAEAHTFHSRSGSDGVLQEQLEGVIAAAFTHYDSRSGDPQLHDHVIVWNRAQSRSDCAWRTLDSRGLYKQVVTLSEIYDGVLEDLLSGALGVAWHRMETRGGQLKVEIQGVGEQLLAEFSQRRGEMDLVEDKLSKAFVEAHGHHPSPVQRRRIAQQANLLTRHQKRPRSLSQMSSDWRERARPLVGEGEAWVQSLKHRADLPALRADDIGEEILGDLAALARDHSAERRATFTRANLLAEVHRQLRGVRFANHLERLAVARRALNLALEDTVIVSAPELHHVPDRYQRADGTTMLRPADHLLYTTETLLDAEQRLLDAGRRTGAATADVAAVASLAAGNLPGRDYGLSVDQALAVQQIATSGRQLDLLIGPAGTGKSTTMAGLRAVWEHQHGAGSVLGLAPSAAAAEVLAHELGIDAENTSKWLFEHRRNHQRELELAELNKAAQDTSHARHDTGKDGERQREVQAALARWSLRPGQIVIVDEASLAGTFALEELTSAAETAGAKVLLVGDQHQLSGVEAGGMFRALIHDRGPGVAELEDVRRFTNTWEKDASLRLRRGEDDVIQVYDTHDRISAGTREELIAELYGRWKADVESGLTSLMIAGDGQTVAELNRRARADRIAVGHVLAKGVELSGEQRAGVGDEVVTRQNHRRLATRRGWVKNGDRWLVTATHPGGGLTVKRAGGGGKVYLPATYVAEHVELAYATTAHRAQGRTVDTAHAMVALGSTREALYVAITRGRDSNRLYIDTASDPDPASGHGGAIEQQDGYTVLAGVLANEGAAVAAHAQINASWDHAASVARLHAEYLTIVRAAQADRWDALIRSVGLTAEQTQQTLASDAYGPLIAALQDAEARGLDVNRALPKLVSAHPLTDADDIAAVLGWRIDAWTERAASRHQPARQLIAGLIPRAHAVEDPDMRRALEERADAIEDRATALLHDAIEAQAGWLRRLGAQPADECLRAQWLGHVRVVVTYRERWNVHSPQPIGNSARSTEQAAHQRRAAAAVAGARAIATATPADTTRTQAREVFEVEPRSAPGVDR
jgi:conjugative relaxase-like TrwC/TraI family protein